MTRPIIRMHTPTSAIPPLPMASTLDLSMMFSTSAIVSSAVAATSIRNVGDPSASFISMMCFVIGVSISTAIAIIFQNSKSMHRAWLLSLLSGSSLIIVDAIVQTPLTLQVRCLLAGCTTFWPCLWQHMSCATVNGVAKRHTFLTIAIWWGAVLGYTTTAHFSGSIYSINSVLGIVLCILCLTAMRFTQSIMREIDSIRGEIGSMDFTSDDTSDGAIFVDDMLTSSTAATDDDADSGSGVRRIRRRALASQCMTNACCSGIALACATNFEGRCVNAIAVVAPVLLLIASILLFVVTVLTTTEGVAKSSRIVASICMLFAITEIAIHLWVSQFSCVWFILSRSVVIFIVVYVGLFQLWIWSHVRAGSHVMSGRAIHHISWYYLFGLAIGVVIRELFVYAAPHTSTLVVCSLVLIPCMRNVGDIGRCNGLLVPLPTPDELNQSAHDVHPVSPITHTFPDGPSDSPSAGSV